MKRKKTMIIIKNNVNPVVNLIMIKGERVVDDDNDDND